MSEEQIKEIKETLKNNATFNNVDLFVEAIRILEAVNDIGLEETAKVVERDACIPGPPNKGKWTPSGCIMGNGWSIAWRVHDAQFWGVPQRRKKSRLSQILQGGQLQKYYLSEKACQGILRRAKNRGKELPKMLEQALIKQANV